MGSMDSALEGLLKQPAPCTKSTRVSVSSPATYKVDKD